jgi:hypothetical protein
MNGKRLAYTTGILLLTKGITTHRLIKTLIMGQKPSWDSQEEALVMSPNTINVCSVLHETKPSVLVNYYGYWMSHTPHAKREILCYIQEQ